MRRWQAIASALVAYGVVAAAATWPLAVRLSTHLPGNRSGDTGVYVWNLWVFRHEIVDLGRSPLSTSSVFSLTPRPDLSLHNYTLLADALALPLIPHVGVVATYNLLLLLFIALNGWAAFLLVRHLTGRPFEAWVAGALFAASPVLMARTTAHFSLVAAFPLPLAVLATLYGLETGKRRYAVAAGASVAAAGLCDPYYAIYAVLLMCLVAAGHLAQWRWSQRVGPAGLIRVLNLLACCALGIAALILATGGADFEALGSRFVARTLYTPMLVVTAIGLARFGMSRRLSVSWRGSTTRTLAVRFAVIAALVGLTGLSPTLYGMGQRLIEGHFDRQATPWRSSPPGVDLLAFVATNPLHPVLGRGFSERLAYDRPDGLAEYTAALPWVALGLIAWACVRRRGSVPVAWLSVTAGIVLLALGPFIHVGGLNTHIPGPWALLRYIPVLEWARSPSRFAIPVALLVAVLFGYALAAFRDATRRRAWAMPVLCGVLAFELLPAPRTLSPASVPAVFDIVKADPDPRVRVLELPTGIRDGVSSVGNFSAATQFRQTYHEKRLVGGYLSRVSRKRKHDHLSFSVFAALTTLSEKKPLTAPQELRAWRDRGGFLRRSRIGYVVMDERRTPPALRAFAIALFELERIDESEGFELFRPRTMLIAGARPPARGSTFLAPTDGPAAPGRRVSD